jgi:hypothetical protein
MTDDLVKRLRAETDRATVNPDGLEAADYIEKLIKSRTNLRIIGKEISERVVSLIAVLNSNVGSDVKKDCQRALEEKK